MSMGVIAVGAAVVGSAVSIYGAEKNRQAADKMASDAETERDAQNALLDVQKAKYEAMEFKNPFEGMENKFQDLENPNEDLPVNQQQAQFQAQQGAQQRSNILQNLRGAAGGSGVAGLAQALAGQGQLQTQRITASIGQQEAANQKLVLGQEAKMQLMEALGERQTQRMDKDKIETMFGMAQQEKASADAARQRALDSQMEAVGSIAGGVTAGGVAHGKNMDEQGLNFWGKPQ